MVCSDFVSSVFHFPHSISLRSPKRYWTTLSIFHEDVPSETGETPLLLPRPLFLCRPTCMGASCLIVCKRPFSLASEDSAGPGVWSSVHSLRAPGNTPHAWGSVARPTSAPELSAPDLAQACWPRTPCASGSCSVLLRGIYVNGKTVNYNSQRSSRLPSGLSLQLHCAAEPPFSFPVTPVVIALILPDHFFRALAKMTRVHPK